MSVIKLKYIGKILESEPLNPMMIEGATHHIHQMVESELDFKE